jgi:hypothetical protein
MCKKLFFLTFFALVLGTANNATAQIEPNTVTTGHVYLLENVSDSNVPDDSANDNTGIIVGDPQVIDGLDGKALLFDGVDDGVDIPDSEFINVTGGPFPNRTVIAVFKCDDVTKPGKQTVFEEGGLTRGLTIYVSNGEVYVGGWNKADYEPQWNPGSWISAPINSNQWYAIALVIRDGTPAQEDDKFEMWMNGNLIGKAPGAEIWNHGNDNAIGYTNQNVVFHDGDGSGDGWFFEGAIDELWILNDALTEAELGPWVGGEQVDMEIGFAIQPPVIDGEVDGLWAGASTQNIVPQGDPANASGSWKALYDSENLYVIVDISDDSLLNDSAASYLDDSVEFYFDGGNTKDGPPLSGDNRQYTFGWTTDEIQGTNTQIEGVEHAQVDTDTGWRIEIKLPWMSLQGAEPQARDLIGIDCFYNDDDDGGDSREAQIWTFATDGSAWNDASQWGTATLAIIRKPVDPGTDGLVAFYALDGDANDISGNELHGTIVGEPAFVEGQVGMALELDGVDDYVDIGNPSLLDFGTGDFTISAWINMTAIERGTVYAKGGDNSGGIRYTLAMGEGNDNKMTLTTDDDSNKRQAMGGTVVNDGVWHHVVGMRSGNTSFVYVDGYKDGTIDLPEGYDLSGTSQANALIGAITDARDTTGATLEKFFAGLIDEVAIYSRALSTGEILYLAGFRPGPVAHYKLDEGEGTIAVDSSGNGNDGILLDGPTVVDGQFGQALAFEVSRVAIPASDSLTADLFQGSFTLSAWINPKRTGPTWQQIFRSMIADDTSNDTLFINNDGRLSWRGRVGGAWAGGMCETASDVVPADQWTHFAVTGDGTNFRIYVNGALSQESAFQTTDGSNATYYIGGDPTWTGESYSGMVDEVRIYDRAISEAEVLGLAGN